MVTQKEINEQYQLNMKQKNLADALKRLYSNPDFVMVFKNHYSKDVVLELVSNMTLYDTDTTEYKEIVKSLNVISSFNQFLDKLLTNGAMAEMSLNDLTAIPDEEIDYE